VNTSEEVGDLYTKVASIDDEPHTYNEAMSRPDAAKWQAAFIEELNSLEHMKVFEGVPRI
jgi:hypothetical protein